MVIYTAHKNTPKTGGEDLPSQLMKCLLAPPQSMEGALTTHTHTHVCKQMCVLVGGPRMDIVYTYHPVPPAAQSAFSGK